MFQIDYNSKEVLLACVAGLALGAAGVASFAKSHGRKARLQRARLLKSAKLHESLSQWKQQAFEKISEESSEGIVALPFDELRSRLQSGELSALEVLHAYQRKAAFENEKFNFICEPVKEAEELALACDTVADRKSKPLLGIPISVKESFPLKGYDSTYGLSGRIFDPSHADAEQIKILISYGAVPFIRTNIPQTMLVIDSHNPIYGYTLNPHDVKRSCGGSSGGEGAALGCSASIAGLGSDIGGSLRIPAAWCGVCSLKPTWQRTPRPGQHTYCPGQNIVNVSSGPMARSVGGLVALSQALFSAEMHVADPYMFKLPFAHEVYSDRKRLRIGYFVDNGVLAVSHSTTRAVMETKAALEKLGHELVPWAPPRMQWAASHAFASVIFGDGGQTFMAGLKGDEISPVLGEAVRIFSKPFWLRKLMVKCLRAILPAYMCDYLTSINGVGSVAGWWELQHEVDEYRCEAIAGWKDMNLDAMICPAMPCPAMLLGAPSKVIGVVCYTLLFNLLNFPAGVLPVTKVSKEDMEHDAKHFPTKDRWHREIKKSLDRTVGLPVAVQCVALPFQEEVCLRIMKEVEESVDKTAHT